MYIFFSVISKNTIYRLSILLLLLVIPKNLAGQVKSNAILLDTITYISISISGDFGYKTNYIFTKHGIYMSYFFEQWSSPINVQKKIDTCSKEYTDSQKIQEIIKQGIDKKYRKKVKKIFKSKILKIHGNCREENNLMLDFFRCCKMIVLYVVHDYDSYRWFYDDFMNNNMIRDKSIEVLFIKDIIPSEIEIPLKLKKYMDYNCEKWKIIQK